MASKTAAKAGAAAKGNRGAVGAAGRGEQRTRTKSSEQSEKWKHIPMIGLYREHCPEAHVIRGKFVFLYILFAATMLVFAGLTVWLFFFSTALLEKYEAIDVCARVGNCQIVVEGDTEEVIKNQEGTEE